MNKKRIILVIGLLLLLVLSSCQGGRVSTERPRTTNYFEGNDGLSLEFLDQAPPDTVFETSNFDTQVYVKNLGAFSLVEPYAVKIDLVYDRNVLTSIFSPTENLGESQSFNISGRSLDWPDGEEKYILLNRFNANEIAGNFQTNLATFIAQICYPYQTNFADELCIDTDTEGTSLRDEVCEKEDKTYNQGQGAPLAITAVESQMIPRGVFVQPQFTIHIEHKGEGSISYRDIADSGYEISQCTSIEREDVNKISVQAILAGERLTCLPNEVILKGGKAKIQCQLTQDSILGVASNYRTTLVVKLGYLYSESYRKDIVIQKSEGTAFENLQQEETDCFNWETYDEAQEKCVTTCEYKAEYDQSFDGFDKIRSSMNQFIAPEYDQEYLWDNVRCVYQDATSCKDNTNLCLLQNDLCQPGSYCGLPACVLKNRKPQISNLYMVGLDQLQFYCTDGDDGANLQRTCGCINEAYYGFVDKSIDCNNISSYTQTNLGKIAVGGIVHQINGFENSPEMRNQTLCILVKDKLNQTSIRKTKYPFKYY